ncbi:MAG: hypothetical protein JNK47_01155 [Mesorhizobium sp.]|nr:hypothetical protein [Mesorhizobium sp.]MBL8575808.1 hypothetical protein [Mesorhizobium sp.]
MHRQQYGVPGLAAALIAFSVPAFAVELDIPGDYGNEAGCRHARTNDYSEDDMVLLTRKNVSTYVTMCSFVQIFPAEANSQVMIVTCGHEGQGETTLGLMRVQKSENDMDGYLVFDEAGTLWGKVGRCS